MQLPSFGQKGAVVRNIRIERDKILSSSSLSLTQADSAQRKAIYRKKKIEQQPVKPNPVLLELTPPKQTIYSPIDNGKKPEKNSKLPK